MSNSTPPASGDTSVNDATTPPHAVQSDQTNPSQQSPGQTGDSSQETNEQTPATPASATDKPRVAPRPGLPGMPPEMMPNLPRPTTTSTGAAAQPAVQTPVSAAPESAQDSAEPADVQPGHQPKSSMDLADVTDAPVDAGSGQAISDAQATSQSAPTSVPSTDSDADDSTTTDDDGISGADSELLSALEELKETAGSISLPLVTAHQAEASQHLRGVLDQLKDYILPRLRQLDAPLLVVVGGSTGAGKSTLVNSLVGEDVSQASVIRPTTRSPVLVHNPEDARWFNDQRILPSLSRVTGHAGDPRAQAEGHVTTLRLVPSESLPLGLALLDAPDIDSVVKANRELANQLLAAADLWLFVTTAARYADAVPWDLLAQASERCTSVAIVLDRVPAEHMSEVRADLARMLKEHALETAPLFTIPETITEDGRLPVELIAPLERWLSSLGSDAKARSVVVRRTLAGALNSLRGRIDLVAREVDEQNSTEIRLREEVEAAYQEADRNLEQSLTDGTLLRGEVLARWQELVGTGELFKTLETKVGRWRDMLTNKLRGKRPTSEPLGEALHVGVSALIKAQAQDAMDKAVQRWRDNPAGEALLKDLRPQETHLGAHFDEALARTIRDWQRYVFDLVREEGQHKRSYARMLSFGVNALGVVLMIVVFASTAFVPIGAEVGIGAGSAIVAQKLLEAVFGDQAVRSLAAKARRDLILRVDELLDDNRQVLLSRLTALDLLPGGGDRLRAAISAVEEVRA